MKRLHLYIIKSFIGPFFVTLLISLFVLLMQFLWVYLDELVGKGLDFGVILEFILYTMAMLMTNAWPLAMLLASIMTFGDLGENNELLAMKAAGISLYRIMRPVIILSILMTIGSFYFYNNVIPVSYKKLIALMSSIRQLRPEIIVKEGIFSNDIDNYSIKVGKKSANGDMLYDIMIYDHTDDKGNTNVTVADSGTMKITKDKKYMILNLYSGETYAEMQPRDRQKLTFPSRTDKFEKQSIFTVLKGMELERKDESVFRNQNRALNNSQIVYFVDSLGKALDKQRTENALTITYLSPLSTSLFKLARKDTFPTAALKLVRYSDVDSIMNKLSVPERSNIINGALNSARNNARAIQQSDEMITTSVRVLNRFGIEWHKKYTFAIACLIFVLIGAPLGAIIRKGGLGTPLVISVVLFIFYWIISTTGEKTSRESVSSVWQGVWFSTFIFLPMGILLTYKAANDSVFFNVNTYKEFFKKILKLIKKEDKDNQDKLLQ
ncbi:MAG TPA: LptF/LptG family permease [Prolixibacteraceae bacterium]|nr:LptF/LptG family permease [Prolixibacteraceae bacterium]